MAHRLSTVLNDAWQHTLSEDEHFADYVARVHELIAYVSRSGGIQDKLPLALQKSSGTRPWRSFHAIHHSLHASYDALFDILLKRNEEVRITTISKKLTEKIATFFSQFNSFFDKLECSKSPSLHYVLPVYYMTVDKVCKPYATDPQCILTLKKHVVHLMGEKYWSSTTKLPVT